HYRVAVVLSENWKRTSKGRCAINLFFVGSAVLRGVHPSSLVDAFAFDLLVISNRRSLLLQIPLVAVTGVAAVAATGAFPWLEQASQIGDLSAQPRIDLALLLVQCEQPRVRQNCSSKVSGGWSKKASKQASNS